MNALFIFAFSGLVARLLGAMKLASPAGEVTLKAWLYAPIEALALAPENRSLLFALGFNLAMFAVAWLLWKRKWFIRA